MKPEPKPEDAPDNGLPFGSSPSRSRAPVVFFAVLLAAWIGVLIWMTSHVSPHA